MSKDPGQEEDPPRVFGDGDEDAAPEEADGTVSAAEPEPGAPPRDIRGEVKAIVLGAAQPGVTLENVHDEIKATGYVPEGPVRSALEALTDDKIITQRLLGDPLTIHFTGVTIGPDVQSQRAVCMEIASVPDDRDPKSGKLSLFEICVALEHRTGQPQKQADVETVIDALVTAGIVTAEVQKRAMSAPGPVEGDEDAATDAPQGREVDVTVYGFAPGLLFSLLSPAFNALLAPEEPTTGPNVAAQDAVVGQVLTDPERATLASARAAVAGVYAQRLDRADRRVAAAEEVRNEALRRAAELEATIARAKQRATDQGLHDLFGGLVAPAMPTTVDPRGDAIRYEKRVPMTAELKGQFWDESVGIRTERRQEEAREKQAKKNYEGVKASVAEHVLALDTQLDDMTAASRANTYLIVVPRAYKEMDTSTRKVGVYNYDTGEFVCWDDPADLPKGSQPALPGLDARDATTGTGPAGDAKIPGAKKKPRKKKAATVDGAAESAAESEMDTEAEDGDPAEADGDAHEVSMADDLPIEDRVARQLARGDDSAFKITLVLCAGDNPVTSAQVEAALIKLAEAGDADARAACAKSGIKFTAAEPEPVPVAVAVHRKTIYPAPAAPAAAVAPTQATDEAAASAAVASKTKADAAAAVTPVKAPPKISMIKLLVAELVKARPEGVLWSDARGVLHDEMKTAFEGKTADPNVFKTPSMTMLVAGACQSQIQNRVLAEVAVPEGKRLYHPDNGMPGGTPKADPAAPEAEAPAPAGKAPKAPPKPRTRAKKAP